MATSVAITSMSSLLSSPALHSHSLRSAAFSTRQRHAWQLVPEMRGAPLLLQQAKRTPSTRKNAPAVTPLAVLNRTTETGTANKWSPLPSLKSPGSPADSNTKGWTDERGHENARLVAQLRHIALAASDRAEMHTTIGLQRDNWNKLCHSTVVTTTLAAAILGALNGAVPALPLSLTAFLLNAGAVGLMTLAGKMQPSQLAEEQRSAARQWRAMAADVEATLRIDPRLREDAHLYIDDKLARVQAVDAAYPLPLLPNGLPKFPATVRGSALNAQVDLSEPEMPSNDSNGWSSAVSEDLERTVQKLREADVENYLGWAREKEQESLRLAVGAPVLAAAAAVLNLLQCTPAGAGVQLGWAASAAAACSVVAMLSFSFAQGGQIGMIFEMYRNCAGSYADLDNSVQRALRIPVCQREDGELFHAKVALQLGRPNVVPLVRPGDKTAGNVF